MQRITKSVGKGGKNEPADVKVVQELLNKFTKVGGYGRLDEDGKAGKSTLAAIAAFQEKVLGMSRPDSLVEPGKNTIKKLNENPSAVAKEAEENADGGGGKAKGKVTGKTSGVGSDILDYLGAVANHYALTIIVTSGVRSPEEQGEAMFDNWIDLDRGNIYASSVLSASDKKTLDKYYVTAQEDDKASRGEKVTAEKAFKKLAAEKVGRKTKHATGRAVDIKQSSLSAKAYKAIKAAMEEKKEGQRNDIYHFESESTVPQVSERLKAKWPAK